jgi:hypothetical protein
MRTLSVFIGLVLLVGMVMGAPRASAQEGNDYVELTRAFMDAYFSDTNEGVGSYMAADASSEFDFCAEPWTAAKPTHLKAELLVTPDPDSIIPPVGVVRVTSDEWTVLVVIGEDNNSQYGPYFIQQVLCEGSPAARTLEMLAASEISSCAQDFLRTLWARASWINREGDRALVRVETNFISHVIYVYLTRENDAWVFDQEICNSQPDGLALDFFTQYMMERAEEFDRYDPAGPFYYLGSSGLPTFVDVTSVRVDRERKGPAIVAVQFENQETDQPDFTCAVTMKADPTTVLWWVIDTLRCTNKSSTPR